MALGGDPDALDISDEFGLDTRGTSLTQYDLADMYQIIFGNGAHDRKQFAGYGAPELSNFSASTSSDSGGKIDINFSLSVNNLTASVRIEYQENDGGQIPTGDWESLGTISYNDGGSKSETVQMPNASESYHIRLGYYNKFNNASYTDYLFSGISSANSSSGSGGSPTVGVTALQYISGSNTYYHSWDYINSGETSFMVEGLYDTSSDWEPAGVNNITSSGNDYNGDLFTQDILPPSGATSLQFRMRKNTSEAWAYGSNIAL